MKIFIDTANLDQIKKIDSWGILDGVTTNPSLVAKEGTDTPTRVAEIAKILGDRPVSAEVMALDAEGMIEEGRRLAKIAPNVNVKLPMCEATLKATKVLSEEGIDVMLAETVQILNNYGYGTQVIAASIRNPMHVLDAAEMGCDIATIPFNILELMLKHPKTDEGIAKFKADYEKVNGKQ